MLVHVYILSSNVYTDTISLYSTRLVYHNVYMYHTSISPRTVFIYSATTYSISIGTCILQEQVMFLRTISIFISSAITCIVQGLYSTRTWYTSSATNACIFKNSVYTIISAYLQQQHTIVSTRSSTYLSLYSQEQCYAVQCL